MTSPVIPAPAVPTSRCAVDVPVPPPSWVSGLPSARTAEAVECDLPLTVDLDADAERVLLRAEGEIDMLTVDRLRAGLDESLAARRAVVVDLTGVTFIDCTGIGLLADARHRARCRGGRLEIVPGRAVARTAALLGLTAALDLPAEQPR